ncbi:MAG: hypothetical protein WCG31_06905 [Deltaproteobacteria bacterium]
MTIIPIFSKRLPSLGFNCMKFMGMNRIFVLDLYSIQPNGCITEKRTMNHRETPLDNDQR